MRPLVSYIERYLELFDGEELLVLVFEDLCKDPISVYRRCFQFLGVDGSFRCAEMEETFNQGQVRLRPL